MRDLRSGAVILVGIAMLLGLLGPRAEAETRVIKLSGFDEVPVVITGATGSLQVRFDKNAQTLDYTLTYENIEGGAVTQAHIHIGQQHTTGGILVFLCTNLGNAPVSLTHPTPLCPSSPGEVSGTVDASNVVAQAAQGVGAGDLAAVIEAIRNGVAYGNVHTTGSPSGEMRANFPGNN